MVALVRPLQCPHAFSFLGAASAAAVLELQPRLCLFIELNWRLDNRKFYCPKALQGLAALDVLSRDGGRWSAWQREAQHIFIPHCTLTLNRRSPVGDWRRQLRMRAVSPTLIHQRDTEVRDTKARALQH